MTQYGYDAMDRPASLTVASGATTRWAERYGYNAAGQRVFTLSGPTGTAGDAYSLDATSQLRGVKYAAPTAASDYDSAGTPGLLSTWIYDAAGNRTAQVEGSATTTYTANDINQYTAVGSTSPSYSQRGDLTGQADWTFGYDAFGNLIRATDSSSGLLAQYWTDGLGQRAIKDVAGARTLYFNAGLSQLEAYDVTSSSPVSTIFEPGIDRPLARVDGAGTLSFYHQDWLGSVSLLTNSAGAVEEQYRYGAWGNVTSAVDGSGSPVALSAIKAAFLYTGRQYDAETSLHYYRARSYSAELGRFFRAIQPLIRKA